MKVNQVYELVNAITGELTGKTDLLSNDLSNIASVGDEIFGVASMDNYVNSLINHIGKVTFSDRKYEGMLPSLMVDSWTYGSITQKVDMALPEADKSNVWALEDRKEYSDNKFYQPKVSAKFFNGMETFRVPISFTRRQVRESFSNKEQLNGFISLITTSVENSLNIELEGLTRNVLNKAILGTLTEGVPTQSVSIRALYNETREEEDELSYEEALEFKDKEFMRFAAYILSIYQDRLASPSVLFNNEGKVKFTPKDKLNTIMLSNFKSAADVFLSSDTFHKELVSLPNSDVVPFWQGSGTDYDKETITTIEHKIDGDLRLRGGIVAVMFDREAVGVSYLDRYTTTSYTANGDFNTNYNYVDAGYFIDHSENFVVFTL